MIVRVQGASELQNKIYYEYDTDSVPLGEGGMGIVYQGRCFRMDNPNEYIPVAIKLVTNTSQDMIDRAMREASIQIDHPNMLRMYGFIPNMEIDPYTSTYKPKYYVVMELLEGVSLEDLMSGVFYTKSGVLVERAQKLYDLYTTDSIKFAVEVMSKVLEGIKQLHSLGFIHRDIDPSNIMVTSDGDIKIIDYGICKPVHATEKKLTMNGAIIGKADYGAPELMMGDVSHHNVTTDIYTLGIITYQLATGRLPFEGDNSSVIKAHISQDVPVENIPDAVLRSVVAKATAKEQSARYQSVEQMMADLFSVLNPKTENVQKSVVTEQPVSVNEQFVPVVEQDSADVKPASLNLWLVAGVVISGLALGIIAGFVI